MRSDRVTDAKGWPAVRGPRHGEGDSTADTNLIVHAGRNLALVEAGALPVELRYELDTVSRTDLAGSLPGGFTAHPKRDPATGERHAVAYYWRWDYLQYLVVGTDGHLRRRVDVPAAGSPMAHDMALTASFVVLLDLPVTFDVHAAASGASFPYRWNPSPPLREEPGQPGAGVRAPQPRCSRGRRLGALLLHDATTDTSDVAILVAQDFSGDPIATITSPSEPPSGSTATGRPTWPLERT